jgi:hypothetical protein
MRKPKKIKNTIPAPNCICAMCTEYRNLGLLKIIGKNGNSSIERMKIEKTK